MTKGRKIGISLAFALIFMLVCMSVIPLYNNVNEVANAAAPVITDNANTWENPYDGTYYNNLNTNLTGAAFRTQLASLITSTHTKLTTYSGLADVFKESDADPDKKGNIIWFYTGTSVSFSGSFGSSVGSTNREHVWAKNGGDTFPAQSGPGADAHHLRPTEMQLNGYRSNYGFGEVPQNSSTLQKEAGKSDYGSSPDGLCYLSGGLFYPAKGYRGATARILFYMQVRWGDENGLYFVDGTSTSNGKGIGKITDLLKWHLEEPPTDQEIRRNEVVYSKQGNRNPFIDHPEYAEMIYCNGYDSNSSKLQNVVAQTGLSYLDNANVGGGNGGNGGGGTDTPDPTPTPGLDSFDDCIAAINSATTLEERYAAIVAAIDLAQTESDRNRLQELIDQYNQDVKIANYALQDATNVASQSAAQAVSMSFFALVLIVVKRTLGR